MLSYRHVFHAGNHADVLKHAVLALLLQALARKDKPYVCIDTHAGAGRYDLGDARARRTGEASAGVAHWWTSTAAPLAPWLAAVRALNPDGTLRWYPGSPLLARGLMRERDRLLLCELHPADHAALAAELAGDAAVRVERADGYARLKAWLPPRERRGLVLIDPPYERKAEEAQVVELLVDVHRRFATGVFAIWYPVLTRLAAQRFVERLAATGIRDQLAIEYLPAAHLPEVGLKGSGMLIVNAPYRFERELEALAGVLAEGDAARTRLRRIAEE
ncbi:MAG TPA: 23S rRNA (adenine(2030)-N(6))-methyltransferase RlmJ [Gammaproteobacteria bacterium]|nr:23S rRNA (adenine(2030)-N(6))-methyltransferase RlmJ [Gammaproteobacteria bacterium]